MTRRVSTALARPVRTAGQGGLGYAVMAVIQSFHHFAPEQYGALVLLFTIVFGWVQVMVENRVGKAILRDVPSRTAPLVDEAPKPTASSDESVLPRSGSVSTTRTAVAKKATPRRRRSSSQ